MQRLAFLLSRLFLALVAALPACAAMAAGCTRP
jgi:hypothetical protein